MADQTVSDAEPDDPDRPDRVDHALKVLWTAPSSAEVLMTLEEVAGAVFTSILHWPTAETRSGDVELFCDRVRIRVALADRLGLDRLH
jgi:hypothetical protein